MDLIYLLRCYVVTVIYLLDCCVDDLIYLVELNYVLCCRIAISLELLCLGIDISSELFCCGIVSLKIDVFQITYAHLICFSKVSSYQVTLLIIMSQGQNVK